MPETLVERIRKHDRRAMGELYERYVETLASVCYRYVPEESDAKDVLQNSFVKIFTSIPTFEYRDEPSFRGWMVRIVVNEALQFLKEQRRLQFTELTESISERLADEEPPIERITADELHRLISELPDGYRTVVNLYVFERRTHKEIAALLNIKATTSASQLHYAKQLLAKRIDELIRRKA